jgi:hypothetical protein
MIKDPKATGATFVTDINNNGTMVAITSSVLTLSHPFTSMACLKTSRCQIRNLMPVYTVLTTIMR